MSKNYDELRDKMSPEARDRAAQRTAVMMSPLTTDEALRLWHKETGFGFIPRGTKRSHEFSEHWLLCAVLEKLAVRVAQLEKQLGLEEPETTLKVVPR